MARSRDFREEFECTTRVVVSTPMSFTWSIENFSILINKPGDALKSSPFSSEFKPNTSSKTSLSKDKPTWNLVIRYGCGNRKDHIALYLNLISYYKEEIMVKYTLCILDNENNHVYSVGEKSPRKFNDKKWYAGYKTFIKISELRGQAKKLLVDDTLKLFCEIIIVEKTIIKSIKEFMTWDNQLACDFGDIVLEAGDEKFVAHKNILAAKSPTFAAMFADDTMTVVKISDMDKNVLREVLRFIYTEQVANMEKMVRDLLAAADKYALEKLKTKCEIMLWSNLTIENATDILILALFNNSCKLKRKVLEFIQKNRTAIMKSEGWTQ